MSASNAEINLLLEQFSSDKSSLKSGKILELLRHKYSSQEGRITTWKDMFERIKHGKSLKKELAFIAAKVAQQFLNVHLDMNEEQIKSVLDELTMAIIGINPDRNKELPRIRSLVEHQFIQYAALMAKYLDKPDALQTIINLSKHANPCYRVACFKEGVWDEKIAYRPHQSSVIFQTIGGIGISGSSIYTNTIKAIYNAFLSPEIFDKGLMRIEEALKQRLSYLSPLDDDFDRHQPQFFETTLPSGKAFLWWKNLPIEARKMYGAMNAVLGEIEKDAGYGSPDDNDGILRFWGFVPPKIADALIKEGGRFSESVYTLPGVLHGVHAHRIQLAIISELIRLKHIPLPEGKRLPDLVRYIMEYKLPFFEGIIKENILWPRLLDSGIAWAGSPEYVMSYLRNALHLPYSRLYAVFSFLNGVDKNMNLNNIPASQYETYIFPQICEEFMFNTDKPSATVVDILNNKRDLHSITPGFNESAFFYYTKKKQTAEIHEIINCSTPV